jgi:hypothetical protein
MNDVKACAVIGCVCAAEPKSDVCAVHRQSPNLSPTDGDPCRPCEGRGTCPACQGARFVTCQCHCGDQHEADCDDCDRTGKCLECKGSGLATPKRLASAAP